MGKLRQELITVSEEYTHYLNNRGKLFSAAFSKPFADSEAVTIVIKTNNPGKVLHLAPIVEMSGETKIEYIIEAETTGGTPITAYPRNLNSTETLGAAFTHTPATTPTPGTVIVTLYFGGTDKFSGTGGVLDVPEFIFEDAKTYMIRITNLGTTTNNISATLYCHEDELGI